MLLAWREKPVSKFIPVHFALFYFDILFYITDIAITLTFVAKFVGA